MTERKGGYETVKKVEIGGVIVGLIGLLGSMPAVAIAGLLAVTGAETYKYYQNSQKGR